MHRMASTLTGTACRTSARSWPMPAPTASERHAHGDVIMVRYADDIVVGFEHQADAERFWQDMRARLAEFALTLHPGKTRLIEFGRHAAKNRRARDLGKPETFNFLGFTHISGHSRRGG